MAIPSIQQFSQQPGGGLVTALRGGNALTKENLENKILGEQAKYAPYSAYGDALSKIATANMVPYQLQSQIMSNPMLWMAVKDNPAAINALVENFGKSIPDMSHITGSVPAPSQRSQGLLGALLSKLQMGHEQEQAQGGQGGGNALMQPPAPLSPTGEGRPTNPLVPATGSGAAAVAGNAMAPGMTSPYKAGSLIADPNNPGGVRSVPTAETTAGGQKAVLAAKRVEPIINNIFRDFQDVNNVPGMAKLAASYAGNVSGLSEDTLKKFGVSPTAYSKYIKAQNNIDKSIIDVMKVYDLHQEEGMNERIGNILKFHPGENKEGYFDRIKSELNDIKTQQGINEGAIGGGFGIGGQQGEAPTAPQATGNKQPQNAYKEDLQQPNNEGEPLKYDMASLQETARVHGISVPEVIKQLEEWDKTHGAR
jgi:hypothetical protein